MEQLFSAALPADASYHPLSQESREPSYSADDKGCRARFRRGGGEVNGDVINDEVGLGDDFDAVDAGPVEVHEGRLVTGIEDGAITGRTIRDARPAGADNVAIQKALDLNPFASCLGSEVGAAKGKGVARLLVREIKLRPGATAVNGVVVRGDEAVKAARTPLPQEATVHGVNVDPVKAGVAGRDRKLTAVAACGADDVDRCNVIERNG